MRKFLLLFVLCSSIKVCYSQSYSKNLVSVIYLNSQEDLISRVKDFFRREVPKKSKVIPFWIDDRLFFIDMEPFNEVISNNPKVIDWPEIDSLQSRKWFKGKFYFEPESTNFLGNLIAPSSEKLILNFSKSYGNVLIAEITDFKMGKEMKLGKGYRIMFIFNEHGLVNKTYEKTFVYN